MYVCVCHAISERQVLAAIDDGASTLRELRRQFDLCSRCGRCGPCVRDLLAAALPARDGAPAGEWPLAPSPA